MNRSNQFRVAKARVRPRLFVAALLPGTYRAKRWTADPGEARIFTYNVAQAVAGRNRGALLTVTKALDGASCVAPALLFAALLSSCGPQEKAAPEQPPAAPCVAVVAKNDPVATHYVYRFDVLSGRFALVPSVATEHLLILSNGRAVTVDLAVWSVVNVGDSVGSSWPYNPCNTEQRHEY